MKCILVNPSNRVDLLYLPTLLRLGYKPENLRSPGKILVEFNGTKTNSLGEIVLPISAGLVTALVQLTVVDKPLSFNTILGRT